MKSDPIHHSSFDLQTFFEKFDQFADAPNAVAKMRELILESAIRGGLVPQNDNDEPASELIARLESDLAAGSSRTKKWPSLPPVGDDAYLDLPPSWAWIRLGQTGRIFNGDSVSESGKAELAKVKDGHPFIATKDVGYGRAALAYDNGLKVSIDDPRFKVAKAQAVLICAEGGSAGRKIGITDRDICFGNKLYANEVRDGIHHRFIFYVYQAPMFYRQFASRMTGIIGGISRSEFLSLPIPLPPEAEQRRIVAKVDELMALCDRLEAQQQERETQKAALARAALARFADAPTPANLERLFYPSPPCLCASVRIKENVSHRGTETQSSASFLVSPTDIRKSILTLAVQGKLVPQDPNDEPAEELLSRILTENPRLRDSFKEPTEPANAAENLAIIPESWVPVALGRVMKVTSSKRIFESEYADTGVPFFRSKEIGDLSRGESIKTTLYISAERYAELKQHPDCPQPGDLLLTSVGTIGNTWIVDDREFYFKDGNITQIIRTDGIGMRYVQLYIASPMFMDAVERIVAGTAYNALTIVKIKTLTFPLPPLAEQKRIVAKVEQLMALVDELETQLATSRAVGEKLLTALVAELTTTKVTHSA